MKKLLIDWLVGIPENIDEETTKIKNKLIQCYYEDTCHHSKEWWDNNIQKYSTLSIALDRRFDFYAFKAKYNLDIKEFWTKTITNPDKYQIINKEFSHYN